MTKDESRKLLHDNALRVTAPRLAVLRVLSEAESPLSYTEVLGRLGESDWDPATIYRNLVKLRDAGIAPVVSRAAGIDRYSILSTEGERHQHPHFVCDDCGRIECLPGEFTVTLDGAWAASIQGAMIELRGACPDCRRPT